MGPEVARVRAARHRSENPGFKFPSARPQFAGTWGGFAAPAQAASTGGTMGCLEPVRCPRSRFFVFFCRRVRRRARARATRRRETKDFGAETADSGALSGGGGLHSSKSSLFRSPLRLSRFLPTHLLFAGSGLSGSRSAADGDLEHVRVQDATALCGSMSGVRAETQKGFLGCFLLLEHPAWLVL